MAETDLLWPELHYTRDLVRNVLNYWPLLPELLEKGGSVSIQDQKCKYWPLKCTNSVKCSSLKLKLIAFADHS